MTARDLSNGYKKSGKVVNHILCSLPVQDTITGYLYYTLICPTTNYGMTTMEEKLNALLCSVESLKQAQGENQEEMSRKLSCLESNVKASQEDTAQRLAKKIRREKVPES